MFYKISNKMLGRRPPLILERAITVTVVEKTIY